MIKKILLWLEPTALKRLDRYLLLHHPTFWALRIHYVLFVAAVMDIFALAPLVYPVRPHHIDEVTAIQRALFGFAIAFILGLSARQSRSGVEKEFGPISHRSVMLRYVGNMVCAAAISSCVLVFTTAARARMAQVVTHEQLARDLVMLAEDRVWPLTSEVAQDTAGRTDPAHTHRLATAYKFYMGRPVSTVEVSWSETYSATRNVRAIQRLVGAERPTRGTSSGLLFVFGSSLGMLGFVAACVSVEAYLASLWATFSLVCGVVIGYLFIDVGYEQRTVVSTLLGLCAAMLALLFWRTVSALRSQVSSLVAESSVAALGVAVSVTLQIGVVYFAPDQHLHFTAAVALFAPLLCVPMLHRALITIISLPRR